MSKDIYWTGEVSECELCDDPLTTYFVDGRTLVGPWACMCTKCFYQGRGVGRLGTGNGQLYQKQPDGRWLKVDG